MKYEKRTFRASFFRQKFDLNSLLDLVWVLKLVIVQNSWFILHSHSQPFICGSGKTAINHQKKKAPPALRLSPPPAFGS